MKILVACEMSGEVRRALRRRGHDAWSCDILPALDGDEHHLQTDVMKVLGDGWAMMIGFPPCDHLAVAGAAHWKAKRADGRQRAAIEFFLDLWHAPIPRIALENPTGIMSSALHPPTQVIQPWWFGEPFAKRTCLWLRKLPKLVPTLVVEPTGRVATGGGSWASDSAQGKSGMSGFEDRFGREHRKMARSLTFPGVAEAMAEQWGSVRRIERGLRAER